MFRRASVRYGRTPEPETPYQRAAQVWDERIGSARVQAKNWRLMAFGSLLLSCGLAAGLVWQSTHGTVVPWVVQIDQLGEARAIAPATADYTPSDPQIAWYLARFIKDVRAAPADPVVVRQNWLQAYDFTTTAGAAALNDYARANDPFAKARQAADRRRRLQRHPRLGQLVPRRLDRAPLSGRRARRHHAMDGDPHHRHPAADRRRSPPQESARRLRQRHQLVEGARTMTRPNFLKAGDPASHIAVNMRFRIEGNASLRKAGFATLLISAASLAGCAKFIPPDIDYDDAAPARLSADPPAPVKIVTLAKPLPLPGQLKPLHAGKAPPEPADPAVRVNQANAAARVQPVRDGFINAVQVYPFSGGALYQVYAAPGQITDVALQEGEQLVGSGPVAAGDTVRWIIGDTESGAGATKKIHILVKPTRPDLVTNLVINTDRRTYLLELRSTEKTYMASVSWQYPEDQLIALAPAERGCGIRRADRDRRRRLRAEFPLRDPGRQSAPGGRCAPSTTDRRSISNSRPAFARARRRRSSSSVRPAARSSSTIASAATTTSSIASSPPPNCASATRTANGACASSAPTEGRGHDAGRE